MDEFFGCLGIICLLLFLIFIGPFIVMLLWNSIVVSLFNAPMLGYWQTFGLIIMIRLIISPFRVTSNKD